MPAPRSTYRLQLNAGFDLTAAAGVCGYLADLGVGALYLSPLLPAAAGSDHGYDVIGFEGIDEARGGGAGWARLRDAAATAGLGIVIDIVPNHTGVATPGDNPAWWDVLRLGPQSRYASWFDIDWTHGRVRLPVLGDDFGPDQLSVTDGELRYFEHRFPLAPGTDDGTRAATAHDRQHYELVSFRRADADHNYRRFFAVTTLAGLRVEDPDVFEATHTQIRRWVTDDGVVGLRVDHPDGLLDPAAYLHRLRDLAGPEAWLIVEKILEPGERLPSGWPVAGTTGYDALAEVAALFVDPAAEVALDAIHWAATGDTARFAEHMVAGKRFVATTILRAEVNRLAALAPMIDHADQATVSAIIELAAAFPVYRSYLPLGAEHLAAAIDGARSARPDLNAAIDALAPRLADPDDELAGRFQQLTGAVMAKGVEDTAYYRYSRFVAPNEVGGDPSRPGRPVADFHAAQAVRLARTSAGMTTLGTHDTKRGEDVRARLAVIAELPDEWSQLVRELMGTAPVPARSFGYLLWQTFVGTGFIDRDRMHAYAEKAMREAATDTGWTDPDADFEATVHAAVDIAYDDPGVRGALEAFLQRVEAPGWSNALGQKLAQLTMPGVPNVYQGTELWGDSLVDPDNRRPVDFELRHRALAELDAGGAAPPVDGTGRAKLWVTAQALRLRRDRPELFGRYRALTTRGAAAAHAVAFDRGGAVTVVTRLPVALARGGGWYDTVLRLPRRCHDELTGRDVPERVKLSRLLDQYPVALLRPY